jgi:peptide/nickel transport system ATP-binding protein
MLLSLHNLTVSFRSGKVAGTVQRTEAVGRSTVGVSFDIPENTTVALVGESGSGKSVTAMAILNLLPRNAERQGRVEFLGQDLLVASSAQLQRIRGRQIACIFQDPMGSLNPVFTVGQQVMEPLRQHLGLSKQQAAKRAVELLDEVGLPEPRRRLHSYPHALSGGQQQRVMIAMALSCSPKLLIADEPTTALDVTVQRQILELLAKLKKQRAMGLLFISHDLGLVGEIADHVVVMRHGTVREQGSSAQIFNSPQDAYTRALLACRPSLEMQVQRLAVVDDHLAGKASSGKNAPPKDPHAPIALSVQGLKKSYWVRRGWFGRHAFEAVKGADFTLRRGHTLGVVGESGSGKSTLGLALLHLHEPSAGQQSGRVMLGDQDILTWPKDKMLALRRRIQVVFQNPYASLNPRMAIGQILTEPLRIHSIGANQTERDTMARTWLQRVGLAPESLHKYPHEFSGGQCQRIAIARALTVRPEVLVLDEAVSALDVSVQAQVLNLLKDLQDELGTAYVFISHDLAVVRFMADTVMVMQSGNVVEQAPVDQLMSHPKQAYTRQLLGAVARGYPNAEIAPGM